jgi:hypothetical protein
MSAAYPPINAKIWTKTETELEDTGPVEIEHRYISPYPGRCADISVPDWLLENGAIGQIQWSYTERSGSRGVLVEAETAKRDIDVGYHSYPGVLVQNKNGVLAEIEDAK